MTRASYRRALCSDKTGKMMEQDLWDERAGGRGRAGRPARGPQRDKLEGRGETRSAGTRRRGGAVASAALRPPALARLRARADGEAKRKWRRGAAHPGGERKWV